MSMPARPGAVTGPAMATYALIRYFCSSMPPQSAAASSPLVGPLLIHITKLIHGVDPPSPSLAHFRECLDGALDSVPAALKASLYTAFDSWWAALRPSHWCIQQIFTQLDTCMQPFEEVEQDVSISKVRYVDRRSTLGMFLRRARLTYDKSDIHQQTLWAKMLCEWRDIGKAGEASYLLAGSSSLVDVPYPPGSVGSASSHAPATVTRMRAFDSYQAALQRGDYSAAKEHMFTFFDHTARGATREMHQHALLNLAALHLEMDSPAAAEPALHEAILLARSSKDWECVSACESLLKRVQEALNNESESQDCEDVEASEGPPKFSASNSRDAEFQKLFHKASKLARRGLYEDALHHLLSTKLLAKLSMREHGTWQTQIWHVFWLWARRRGVEATLSERILAMCPSADKADWVGRWQRGDHTANVDEQGKGNGRTGSQSRFIVLNTANRLVHEYGQRGQARALLDEIMPEVKEDDDVEVRGIVQWLYAQTLLDDQAHGDTIRAACEWLQQALHDFEMTECLLRQGDVLYYLARLYDLVGETAARDAAAEQLLRLEDAGPATAVSGAVLANLLDEVIEAVGLVGANVAVGIPVLRT